MDENKKLKVLLGICSCLLILFGAYIFYLDYNKGSNNNEVDISEEKINSTNNSENKTDLPTLSINEVTELVTKYTKLGAAYSTDTLKFYFGENSEGTKLNYNFENTKLFIAINNTIGSTIDDCKTISNEDIVLDGEWYTLKDGYFHCNNNISKIYSYDDVNEQYKILFGSSENVQKNSVSMNEYYYFNNNQYISLHQHDGSLWPDGMISKITDYKQEDKNLEVTVSYLYDSKYEAMPMPEITYEDINNIFNGRNDYSSQYRIEFEYEQDHYILKDINKVI